MKALLISVGLGVILLAPLGQPACRPPVCHGCVLNDPVRNHGDTDGEGNFLSPTYDSPPAPVCHRRGRWMR